MNELRDCVCIFDLDGTLVDSAPDLTAALNRALLREGLDEIDERQVRGLVGEGALALLRRGFAMQDAAFPDGAECERLVAEYIDDYVEHIFDASALFPGAEDALAALREAGATLAVCTNKTERLSAAVLAEAGIRNLFAEVVSADTLAEKKPSPLPLTTILDRTGCAKGVMVGDTATDLKAADAAGLPCFIASFGYGAGDPKIAGASQFGSFEQLPSLIMERLSHAT